MFVSLRRRIPTSERERAQVAVFFALLIPVFFALGAIVLDVGNWFVHKRHLQTQVDAAALAPGSEWVGCFGARDGANAAIAAKALEYAGDTTRDPTTTNLQVQTPDDVHVLLNSNTYWSGNPYPPDNTLDTDGDGLGDPCSESALEVRATDHEAPLLWGLLPINPSPKAKARVEIRRLLEAQGMLPLAVPEVDPQAVAAIFVDEENGTVVPGGALKLIKGVCPNTSYPFTCWALDFPSVEINVDRVGVVILLSRDDDDPSLSGTLSQICGQDPEFIICYAGGGNNDGLDFIHGYSGGPGEGLQSPIIRDVDLFDVNCAGDHSSPYYLMNGECDVLIQANVDFGIPDGTTSAQIAAFPYCVEVEANGVTLSHVSTTDEGSLFEGTLSIAAESGPNAVDIGWRSRNPARNNCNNKRSGTIDNVARPYAADEDSGPVHYLTVTSGGLFANSLEKQPAPRSLRVTVGLQRSLELLPATDPPVLLRAASDNSSQTQALDCDHNNTGSTNWGDEFANGCQTRYSVNFDDWDGDGADEWIDIDCSEHAFGNQPPMQTENDPVPNCVAVQTGVAYAHFVSGLTRRFADPCTPNHWPDSTATQTEIDTFFRTHNFAQDPRYVMLVVADFTAFSGSGSAEPRPIKVFAGFYYTGSYAVPCPGMGEDPHPLGLTGNRARFDMWGHFMNRVEWSGAGSPSDNLCQFEGDVAACIAVLVE